MHVDLDRPATGGDTGECLFPEAVVTLGDAAFDVDAEGDAGDLGHFADQPGEGGAAVGREVLLGDAAHGVVGAGHIVEVVVLRPQRELEFQAALLGFAGDEFQRLEIGLTLLDRQFLDVDLIAVDVEQDTGRGSRSRRR